MAPSGDLVTHWFNTAGKYPVLPKSEVLTLSHIIRKDTSTETQKKQAIDKLIRHNLKIVIHLTTTFLRRNTKFTHYDDRVADYLQVGVLGLHKACTKFDPTLGYEFSTYASRWIRSYIQRHHYNEWSMIYVPENIINMLNNPKHPKAQSSKMKAKMQAASCVKNLVELDKPMESGTSDSVYLKDVVPDPKTLLVY